MQDKNKKRPEKAKSGRNTVYVPESHVAVMQAIRHVAAKADETVSKTLLDAVWEWLMSQHALDKDFDELCTLANKSREEKLLKPSSPAKPSADFEKQHIKVVGKLKEYGLDFAAKEFWNFAKGDSGVTRTKISNYPRPDIFKMI